MKSPQRVVIIGGGISGLALAHRLTELNRQRKRPCQVALLEAKDRWGGVIESRTFNGYRLEGGPDAFISEKPAALELCRRLGLESEIISTRPEFRKSFIFLKNRLVPVPAGFYLIAPTRISAAAQTPLLSWGGKLRMLLDLVIPPLKADGDESVAGFIRRRLGREVLERIGQPMIAGIYSADPENLSLEATFPRFLELERQYGSVLKGMLARQTGGAERRASGPRYSLFLTLKSGLGKLIETLKEKMPEAEFKSSSPVVRLERGGGWTVELKGGERLTGDALCLAVPAPVAKRLLAPVAPALAAELAGVPYASVATVNFGFQKKNFSRPFEGTGFVVPAIEKRKLIGCTCSSQKFSGRSPEDSLLLRAFVGGSLGREVFDLDDCRLTEAVLGELRQITGVRGTPEFVTVHRYPESMPQYQVGHLKRVASIEERLKSYSGLFLTGNGYRGIGLPDCIREAERCAGALHAFLGGADEN